MKVPLEITFRGVEKTPALEALIHRKAEKLDERTGNLIRCRVTVEKPQSHLKSGSPYQVVIDMRVPPGKELVVRRDAGEGNMHDPLEIVVRDAFDAALRKMNKMMEQLRGEVKQHPEQETVAVISKLFREPGYGFIRSADGREIYFHKNAVLNDDFESLEPGYGVQYSEEMGEDGPKATSVRVTDRRSFGS
ncbi:MAG: cold shock domain-containing protein [Desulfatibacillaceae bacterium]